MNAETVKLFAHTLSNTSKMPCKSYSLPAVNCITGSKLAKIEGTPCSTCYAAKGNYRWSNVTAAMVQRLSLIDKPQWEDAMVALIGRQKSEYFRWHDSGDIQSIGHLNKIFNIAERLPHIAFWLPTLEYGFVKRVALQRPIPSNLTIRLSSTQINRQRNSTMPTSFITTQPDVIHHDPAVHLCPAQSQDGKCGDCRACWNREVATIAYIEH
jgi:hypothetical protein